MRCSTGNAAHPRQELNHYINELRLLVPACSSTTSTLNKVAVLKQTGEFIQQAPQREQMIFSLAQGNFAHMPARLADQEARIRNLSVQRAEQQAALHNMARQMGLDLAILEQYVISREITKVRFAKNGQPRIET